MNGLGSHVEKPRVTIQGAIYDPALSSRDEHATPTDGCAESF
jgi:hypothetical protein